MFEGFKIRKLIGEILGTEPKKNANNITELRKFGPDGLAALVEAFRANKILEKDMESYLLTFYEKSILELYLELLGDSKETVRSLAKKIIRKKAGPVAVPDLVELLKTGNFLQKRAATELLKEYGNDGTVQKLIPLLDDNSRDVKGAVIDLLGNIGGGVAVPHVLVLLSSDDWWVRKKAVSALCKLKNPSSIQPLLSQLDTEKDPKIKTVILQTLGEIGNADTALELVRFLDEADLVTRQMVVEAVQNLGDERVVPRVIEVMKDSDVNIRRAGVEILQNIKDPSATATLIKRLQDPDWWVREIATDALTDLKNPDTNKKILDLFGNEDENVRRSAVEFFKRVPDTRAYDALLQRLKDDDWWVREKAVEALGNLKDERALDHIVGLVDDPDVRYAVPTAVASIGGKKALEFLTDFLQDPDRSVRLAALKGLGAMGEKSVLPMIKAAVKDEDSEIRDRALDIIKEMTGHAVKATEIIAEEERKAWKGGSTLFSSFVPDKMQIMTEAILVLDLCNSTEIGAKFGDDFALKLTSRLVEQTQPVAARNRVRFTKSTGDGYLMTFSEVPHALTFAKEISETISKGNREVPENERIDIRIAIHLGETRVDTKGDRLGTAVNMTFRIEGVKPEGLTQDEGGMTPEEMPLVNRVMISEAVNTELEKLNGFKSRYVGFFDLKGIQGRHRIYQLVL